MALLAQALWHDYPQHYHFFATRRIQFGRYDLPAINGFLTSYRGADGLKTGTTCDAGYNLRPLRNAMGFGLSAWSLELAILPRAAQTWPACLNEGFSGAVAEHGIDIATLRPCPSDPRRVWRVPSLVNLAYRRFPQVYQRCPAGSGPWRLYAGFPCPSRDRVGKGQPRFASRYRPTNNCPAQGCKILRCPSGWAQ
jgi:hypothetical protein